MQTQQTPAAYARKRSWRFPGLLVKCFDAPEWWNGRHDGLKNRCRKVCEFESRLGHHDMRTPRRRIANFRHRGVFVSKTQNDASIARRRTACKKEGPGTVLADLERRQLGTRPHRAGSKCPRPTRPLPLRTFRPLDETAQPCPSHRASFPQERRLRRHRSLRI